MKQAEIWDMYFDPVQGNEQARRRPALIISGNMMNAYLEVVIVCPITSKVKGYKGNLLLYPSKENGLQKDSEVLTFHVRSVAKNRLKKMIGKVKPKEFKQVINCLSDLLRY